MDCFPVVMIVVSLWILSRVARDIEIVRVVPTQRKKHETAPPGAIADTPEVQPGAGDSNNNGGKE